MFTFSGQALLVTAVVAGLLLFGSRECFGTASGAMGCEFLIYPTIVTILIVFVTWFSTWIWRSVKRKRHLPTEPGLPFSGPGRDSLG